MIRESEEYTVISEYIRRNWTKTLRQPILKTEKEDILLPSPFVSPCMDGKPFVDIYYWDTYFINLMLNNLGEHDYAKGNLEDIAYLIGRFGYMPNYTKADGFLRSQPPLFSKGVAEYVSIKNDREFMKRMLPFMEKEYNFWQTERITPIGLNRYGWNADDAVLETFARNIGHRLHLSMEDCTAERGGQLFAEAESGWDFSPRFGLHCADFCPIDLNCILYETENILADFCAKCGEAEKSQQYSEAAKQRKSRIQLYMRGEDGLYYDYNFKEGKCTNIRSSAAFLPYQSEISADAKGCERLFHALDASYGMNVCEERKNSGRFQWDAPNMWPPMVYFADDALRKTGLQAESRVLRKKFTATVEKTFARYGRLYEKYNTQTGSIGADCEYLTPEMLGWTAGVYLTLKSQALEKL